MSERDDRLDLLLARAKSNLATDASKASRERIDTELQPLLAELALEWLVGDRRYESQGQQTEAWLGRIYEEIFTDEQPDATRLYARFGLPLPKSQYLARLLLARRATHWRTAARAEVKVALEAFKDDAGTAVKRKAGSTTRFEISLSRGGYDELAVLYDRLVAPIAGKERPAAPRKLPSSPTVTWFSITADGLLALLEQIRKEEPA